MKKIITGFIGFSAIAALSIAIYSFTSIKKVAYVDNFYLFENSKMKTELYAKLENVKEIRKHALDSLEEQLTELLKKKDELSAGEKTRALQLKENYFSRQQKFTEELRELSDNYNKKVWSHINQLVAEYGKKNKYTYLFGANGQGSIMYAEDYENISDRLLTYINDKYEGK